MSHILHIGEAWCDGNPEIGPTNSVHNLYSTFSQCRKEKFNVIHLDAAELVYKTHLDNILEDYVKKFEIKVIFICLMNGASGNPSFEVLGRLKELGCYLIFHWPDAGNSFGSQTIQELGDIASLHLLWDNGVTYTNQPLITGEKVLRMWVPQDTSLYFSDNQTIPASFIGSTNGYWERQTLIQHIRQYFPQVEIRGGQRQESLTAYEYAKLIRTSKIGINFSNSLAQFWQVKGRVFEILASKSMLFEMNNPATASILTPGRDYVSFTSPKDMLEKLHYYINNDSEREKIANQGFETYNKYYTAQRFWDTVMTRIYSDLNETSKS
jgi:hypothetical protein